MVKILFLALAYFLHGAPFVGWPDYVYALLVAALLVFGIKRDRLKISLASVGIVFLVFSKFIPQLAIPEQQRVLLDGNRQYITPQQFLADEASYPFFVTADGYAQGFKDKRFVRTIDIDGGVIGLRSGWMNRGEYNFYVPESSLIRDEMPFVVRYEIAQDLIGATLEINGHVRFDMFGEAVIKTQQNLQIEQQHVGKVLYGFGGKWDESGFHPLTLKLHKSTSLLSYDVLIFSLLFVGLIFLFCGLMRFQMNLDTKIETLILLLTGLFFVVFYGQAWRWGLLVDGGNDGIIHGGYPYWMLEKLAAGDWRSALMSPENVFYFMPGMRYVRFAEILLFGDAYILQSCVLLFVPVILYRFYRVFVARIVAVPLTLVCINFFVKSMVRQFGEWFAYAMLLLSLTFLMKSLKTTKSGLLVFFLMFIAVAIRPNLAVFVGCIAVIHLFSNVFSPLSFMSRFWMLWGLTPVLLIPLHNILGGSFVLITSASQIPENLGLTPHLYLQALGYYLGVNEVLEGAARFAKYGESMSKVFLLSMVTVLWVSIRGYSIQVRALALAILVGLCLHLFYFPVYRYIYPYFVVAMALGISQIPHLKFKNWVLPIRKSI